MLQSAGDRYAGLARGVAEANTSPGQLARAFAAAVSVQNGSPPLSGADWIGISKGLMQADWALRADTAVGSFKELTVQSVRTYHTSVFALYDLPADAWTAYAPTTVNLSQQEVVWESMLNMGTDWADGIRYFLIGYNQLSSIFTTPWSTYEPLIADGEWAKIMETFRDDLLTNSSAVEQTAATWLKGMLGVPGPDGPPGALLYSQNDLVQSYVVNKTDDSGKIFGGTLQADILNGGAGKDEFIAYAGDDVVFGGDGNDVAYGIDGADRLNGEMGDDLLHGGSGSDILIGVEGKIL